MTIPKRPSQAPPPAPSTRPSTVPSVRPGNVRDALTEAQAIAGGGLAKSTRPSAFPVQTRKTVLVVDPDPTTRARLRDALAVFYDVLEAQDGMEAVELAGKIQPPALVVSDVPMPRVDGLTLAKTLRNHPIMKKVPIMFVSSRNNPQDVTAALVIGVTQFVPKTTPVNDVVARIRKIVV